MEVFGWMCSILFGICYIPQLYQTIRYKFVEGVSLWMWVIQGFAYASGLTYALYIKSVPLSFGYGWGLAVTGLFLILFYNVRR